MIGGFGYWRNSSGFECGCRRQKWVDEHLGREISEPHSRGAWMRWELGNFAGDIESARRRGDTEEATDFAYYAGCLRNELLAIGLKGSMRQSP